MIINDGDQWKDTDHANESSVIINNHSTLDAANGLWAPRVVLGGGHLGPAGTMSVTTGPLGSGQMPDPATLTICCIIPSISE